jgi:hypothetical protein
MSSASPFHRLAASLRWEGSLLVRIKITSARAQRLSALPFYDPKKKMAHPTEELTSSPKSLFFIGRWLS